MLHFELNRYYAYLADDQGTLTGFPILSKHAGHDLLERLVRLNFIARDTAMDLYAQFETEKRLPRDNGMHHVLDSKN